MKSIKSFSGEYFYYKVKKVLFIKSELLSNKEMILYRTIYFTLLIGGVPGSLTYYVRSINKEKKDIFK